MGNERPTELPEGREPEPDGRSFLTPSDRQFLRGEKNLSDGGTLNAYNRIRRRTRNALKDFRVIYEHLPEDQREKVFHPKRGTKIPNTSESRVELPETDWSRRIETFEEVDIAMGCWGALALIYDEVGEDEFDVMLTQTLAHVFAGERRLGATNASREGLEVNLNISHTDTATPLSIVQKINRSGVDRLSPNEQRALLHLLQSTGKEVPKTTDDFQEIYKDYMDNHYSQEEIPVDKAVITLDPFKIEQKESPFPWRKGENTLE